MLLLSSVLLSIVLTDADIMFTAVLLAKLHIMLLSSVLLNIVLTDAVVMLTAVLLAKSGTSCQTLNIRQLSGTSSQPS